MALLVAGLLALAVTVTLCPVVAALLRRGNVLDVPNERSSHDRAVVRGVGAAAAAGVLIALAASSHLTGSQKVALATAVVCFGAIGLVDDLVGVAPLKRLALQPLAAAAVLPALLAGLAGSWLLGVAMGAAALLWLVAFVNAFNFMDGIDGMAVVQALAAGLCWWLVGSTQHAPGLAAGGAIVAGTALGFAPYNYPKAFVFLGDVGSYALGASLAVVAVVGLRAGVPPEAVLAPLALTVADTGTTLLRRIRAGEPWYLAHRTHAYQRLTDLGWSHARTTAVCAVWLVVSSLLGCLSLSGSSPVRVGGDLAVLLLITSYVTAPGWLADRLHPGGGDLDPGRGAPQSPDRESGPPPGLSSRLQSGGRPSYP